MKAVGIEKRKLEEKQRKVSKAKRTLYENKDYSEKQDHLKNERFSLES